MKKESSNLKYRSQSFKKYLELIFQNNNSINDLFSYFGY